MAQVKTPRSGTSLSAWAAGAGFCLAGLLVLPAAGDDLHPVLPGSVAKPAAGAQDKPARPEPRSEPGGGAAGEQSAPFALSLVRDSDTSGSQICILKLKRLDPAPWTVGEALVWWTLPGGRKISIPLKQISDDVWASRVALEKPAGRNDLAVMILGDSGGGRLARILELNYEAELPGGTLKFIGRGELARGAAASAAAAKLEPEPRTRPLVMPTLPKKPKPAWSLQTVMILVGIANVALLFPVLLIARILRRFLGGLDPEGEEARRLYTEIFAGAGLIEEAAEAPAPADAKPARSLRPELFEATVLESPPDAPGEAPRPRKAATEKGRSKKEGSVIDATVGGGGAKVDLGDLTF